MFCSLLISGPIISITLFNAGANIVFRITLGTKDLLSLRAKGEERMINLQTPKVSEKEHVKGPKALVVCMYSVQLVG